MYLGDFHGGSLMPDEEVELMVIGGVAILKDQS